MYGCEVSKIDCVITSLSRVLRKFELFASQIFFPLSRRNSPDAFWVEARGGDLSTGKSPFCRNKEVGWWGGGRGEGRGQHIDKGPGNTGEWRGNE
jgi:hypothetical protein